MKQIKLLLLLASASVTGALAQSNGLTDMSQSRFAKMANTGIGAVHWTDGFWGDRFQVFSQTSLQSLWKTRVFPRFSTHGFCRAAFVENSGVKNSRGERRFCPQRETPQKINFWPRLSFQKKSLWPLFSPDFPSFPVLEYIVYNPKLNFLWKTRWKKWKTLWETPLLFHKSSGKPSGKS